MICANILLYFNIHTYKLQKGKDKRCITSYIEAMTIWMLCTVLLLEGLSLFQGINRISLGASWVMIDLLLLICLLRQRRGQKGWQLAQYLPVETWKKKKYNWCLVAIGLWVVVLALMTSPYNWDSMTYRLTRVAYWAQNGSVEHFATNCARALANPPLGEFVQLHVYVLMGESDIFFNLLQACSYLTCAVLVYAIAKRLQCNGAFSFLATLLFMTMPIAFSEAINTQVDLFSTIWLLAFVYLLMDFVERREKIAWSGENIFKVCMMGLCVAWGYLSKPNVCIAMALFAVWLLIHCIVRKDKFSVLFRLALCALGSMVVPMGWEIARNLCTYHAVSSPIAGARQLVGTLNVKYLLVNFLKNFSFNLPFGLWDRFSAYMLSFMWQFSSGIGVPLNAKEISEDSRQFAYWSAPNYGHDTAINPIVVWLLVICLVLTLLGIRKIKWKKLYQSYSLVAIFSFLVFCTVLRWEPFVTRYMLPFLALLCPAIALILQKFSCRESDQRGRTLKMTAVAYFVVGSISILCLVDVINQSEYHWNICKKYGADEKPYGYFVNRPSEYELFMEVVQYIKAHGYQEIGIFRGEDDYEYPYWALLKEDVERIEQVGVKNDSVVYADTEYQPQCIIWHGTAPTEIFTWNGQVYSNVITIGENRYLLTTEEQ